MKLYIYILLAISIIITSGANAQTRFEKSMQSGIQELYNVKEASQFDAVANKFMRIANAEKDQWLPYYYASLAQAWKSLRMEDTEQKDQLLMEAAVTLMNASKIDDQNAEILAMEGFIHMLRISVDPATRGQSMTPKAFAAFARALKLEPQNPRALLFNGQMQHGMAKFFGSGMDEACKNIVYSVQAFENNKPKSSISPAWGRGTAKEWQAKCESSDESSED